MLVLDLPCKFDKTLHIMEIRAEQMESLAYAQRVTFLQTVADLLRGEMPDAISKVTSEALNEMINASQQKAVEYGIDEPVPLTQFICLTVAAGVGFDTQPDINAYLRDPTLDQTVKMQALIDQVEELSPD